MERMSQKELLISGYIKEMCQHWCPTVILYILYTFYDKQFNCRPCFGFDNCIKKSNAFNRYNDIIGVIINKFSQFYITNNNKLYIKGDNYNGQLGLGYTSNEYQLIEHEYFKNNRSPKIISHGLNNYHCYIYTINNELYGFGNNLDFQISKNISMHSIKIPILIKYEFNSDIISIECGSFHSLFLTINGNVFGCGSNHSYQLNRNESETNNNSEYSIIQIQSWKNIKQIGCSQTSSFALDFSGKIFSIGDIKIPKMNQSIYFDKISVGGSHVCLLNEYGTIYAFGNNFSGQCGINNKNITELNQITKIEKY